VLVVLVVVVVAGAIIPTSAGEPVVNHRFPDASWAAPDSDALTGTVAVVVSVAGSKRSSPPPLGSR